MANSVRTRTSGQGRPKGTRNKATFEIKLLAQEWGRPAIERLALLSGLTNAPGAKSQTTQVLALKELLDRGYGRAAQAITGPDGEKIAWVITGVRRTIDANARTFDAETGVRQIIDATPSDQND